MNDTIRTYPRTSGEAFKDADYANAFEGHTFDLQREESIIRWGVFLVLICVFLIAFT